MNTPTVARPARAPDLQDLHGNACLTPPRVAAPEPTLLDAAAAETDARDLWVDEPQPGPALRVYQTNDLGERTSPVLGEVDAGSLPAGQRTHLLAEQTRLDQRAAGTDIHADPYIQGGMSGAEHGLGQQSPAQVEDVVDADARMVSGGPAAARALSSRTYAAVGVPDDAALLRLTPKALARRLYGAGLSADAVSQVYRRAGADKLAGLRLCLDAYRKLGRRGETIDSVQSMRADIQHRLEGLEAQLGTILYGQRAQQGHYDDMDAVLSAGHALEAELRAERGRAESIGSLSEYVSLDSRVTSLRAELRRVDTLAQRSFGAQMGDLESGVTAASATKDGLVAAASTGIGAVNPAAGAAFEAGVGALDTVLTADANGEEVDYTKVAADAAITAVTSLASSAAGGLVDDKLTNEAARIVVGTAADEGVDVLGDVAHRVVDGDDLGTASREAVSDRVEDWKDPTTVATTAAHVVLERQVDARRRRRAGGSDGAGGAPGRDGRGGPSSTEARADTGGPILLDESSRGRGRRAGRSMDPPAPRRPSLGVMRRLLAQSLKLDKARKKLIAAGIPNPTHAEMCAIAGIDP